MANRTRLSGLDSSFLHLERDGAHMHVAACSVFSGEPPSHEELASAIEARLHLVPRYRQRLAFVPLGQGRPVWVDDPHFNIAYHVRHTALPSPGGEDQLRRLTGRVFSQALDRSKPLWEVWLVEGLDSDRFAILSKTHHALVDGISGVDILTVLFDTSPDPMPVASPEQEWVPAPVGIGDPVERLREISAGMGELKESGQAVGAQVLTTLSGFAPATIVSQAARLQATQRFFNLVVTNVPGPQFPLYVLGRELEAIFPLVPLTKNTALGIAIMSYNGQLNFGLNADFDALPDIAVLAEELRASIEEIREAAGSEAAQPRRGVRPKRQAPAHAGR